jgi:pyruvate formate lyase activating enzyme
METADKNTAMVTNIQGYSIHDGPGIRTVVFFKGCPLRCLWCANPENLSPQKQIGFLSKLCASCGKCYGVCPSGAILTDTDTHRIDREKCIACGACVEACFYGALVRYGEEMDAYEIFEKVRRDKIFYDASKGGVTVSGGEPLLQHELISRLFTLCREEGIDTCVETCGYVSTDAIDSVRTVTDHFCFDLKLISPDAHKEQTGVSNEKILENARHLADAGADVLFRLPLIPGVNDGEENTDATAAFLRSLPAEYRRLELMPFHRAGQTKYNALDMTYDCGGLEAMSAEDIERIRASYEKRDVACTVSR